MYNPDTIHKLQYSTRTNNYKVFKEYSQLMNSTSQKMCTLRGLLDLKLAQQTIPIGDVEPVETIMTRFATGAMSFGSIGRETHETLAIESAARVIPVKAARTRFATFGMRTETRVPAQSNRWRRVVSGLPANIW